MGDQSTYHAAEFVLDTEDKITAIRDPRLAGLSQAQMQQVRVLIYHRPNLVSAAEIAGFDPARGLITLTTPDLVVQRSAEMPVMLYALQNIPTALTTGQWVARRTDGGDIVIYLHPRDPAHLENAIEISTRPTCIDYGPARGVELFGLDLVRAAGQDRLDGI